MPRRYYLIHITCRSEESSFADLFNSFAAVYSRQQDIIFENEHPTIMKDMALKRLKYSLEVYPCPDGISISNINEARQHVIEVNQDINTYKGNRPVYNHLNRSILKYAHILLTVEKDLEPDSDPIAAYRYLMLFVNHFMRSGDVVFLNCDRTFLFRILPYFTLQRLVPPRHCFFLSYFQENIASLPSQVPGKWRQPTSTEWLPAIFISNRYSEAFDLLANTLYSSREELLDESIKVNFSAETPDILTTIMNKQFPKSNFQDLKEQEHRAREFLVREYYKYLISFFRSKMKNDPLLDPSGNLLDRFLYLPGLVQLLFSMLVCNSRNLEDANQLLDKSCDLGECILQIAENAKLHSYGGVLSVRINDNWANIPEEFGRDLKKERQDKYLRVSLVDFSKSGITDNIMKKMCDENQDLKPDEFDLQLFHVFGEKSPADQLPALNEKAGAQNKAEKAYEDFLKGSEHNKRNVIHHYGLQTFYHLVKLDAGGFRVSTHTNSTKQSIAPFVSPLGGNGTLGKPSDFASIFGTEYDVLLPISSRNPVDAGGKSVILTPQYTSNLLDRGALLGDFSYFFNKGHELESYIKESYDLASSEIKEQIVDKAGIALYELLKEKAEDDKYVFYFFLDNKPFTAFNRSELIAKTLLTAIIRLVEKCHFRAVLYGLKEGALSLFVRQNALFYHRRNGCPWMGDAQIYAISENQTADVLFFEGNLRSIANFNLNRRPLTGSRQDFYTEMSRLATRQDASGQTNSPFPFDFLPSLELDPDATGEAKVRLVPLRPWYYKILETVLQNDLHGNDLGCKLSIPNLHFSAGSIHLRTFYNGQLLFGNTFWYQVFSQYLTDRLIALLEPKLNTAEERSVQNTVQEGIYKEREILLYGYESYSEPMLFATKERMCKHGYPNVKHCVFEEQKYYSSEEKTAERTRFCEEPIRRWLATPPAQKPLILYIMGVGTTLSSMKRMHEQLEAEFEQQKEALSVTSKKSLEDVADQFGVAIIQVCPKADREPIPITGGAPEQQEKGRKPIPNLEFDLEKHQVTVQSATSSPEGLTWSFFNSKIIPFLISAESELDPSQSCKLCVKSADYREEYALIQTDETSTVPMIQIKSTAQRSQSSYAAKYLLEDTFTKDFLRNDSNAQYLYYSHILNLGNHYQYFIRTAAMFHQFYMAKNESLKKWFEKVREQETEPNANLGSYDSSRTMNIIVAPLHYGSEAFVAAINQELFQNSAYIINFPVQKVFRDNFVAEFQNYCAALEFLANETKNDEDNPIRVNFYYVDNIIFSGSTILRAKSRVLGLLRAYGFDTPEKHLNVKISLFKAIFVLVNRSSRQTILDLKLTELIDGCLPMYRFLDLQTPAIRSHGNLCPICNQLNRIKTLERESSLSFVALHWQQKEEYHKLLHSSEAKKYKDESNKGKDDVFKTRGMRRLRCSEELWRQIRLGEFDDIATAQEKLEDFLNQCIFNDSTHFKGVGFWNDYLAGASEMQLSELRIEYVISFLKVLSREPISHRETLLPATLHILLSLFSWLVDEVKPSSGSPFYQNMMKLLPTVPSKDPSKVSCKSAYCCFQIVIARLCSLGSTLLLHREQLSACLKKGLALERIAAEESGSYSNDEPSFTEFLCFQMKKMLHRSEGDYQARCKSLSETLMRSSDGLLRKMLDENSQSKQEESSWAEVEKMKQFYSAMYLETVTANESRRMEDAQFTINKFVDKIKSSAKQPGKSNTAMSTNTRQGFLGELKRWILGDHDALNSNKEHSNYFYSNLMELFLPGLHAAAGLMFQDHLERELHECKDLWDITVLGAARKYDNIDILRSELLRHYLSKKSEDVLLDIRDSVRVVRIDPLQEGDETVGSYERDPCIVSFIQIQYQNRNSASHVPKKRKNVYFAFLYPNKTPVSICDILEDIRNFLYFRPQLQERIEKDFDGNLFGIQKKEEWRRNCLSTDKAGSHMDSSSVSKILFKNQVSSKDLSEVLLGPAQNGNDTHDNCDPSDGKRSRNAENACTDCQEAQTRLLEVGQNYRIALLYHYFLGNDDSLDVRKYMDPRERIARDMPLIQNNADTDPLGDGDGYDVLSDLIVFYPSPILSLVGEESNDAYRTLNEKQIYYEEGSSSKGNVLGLGAHTKGKPRPTRKITFSKRYLRAILSDVISNIKKHGVCNTGQVCVENTGGKADCLTFQNIVTPSEKKETSAGKENYNLKRAIEFGSVFKDVPTGFSLGSIVKYLSWIDPVQARYYMENRKLHFKISLPILQKEKTQGKE